MNEEDFVIFALIVAMFFLYRILLVTEAFLYDPNANLGPIFAVPYVG
jgi:hypothetical protein